MKPHPFDESQGNYREEDLQTSELEEELQEAWKQKTAKWRVEERLEAKDKALKELLEVLKSTNELNYYINQITKIIEL